MIGALVGHAKRIEFRIKKDRNILCVVFTLVACNVGAPAAPTFTIYILNLPEGSVLMDTRIRMTPVKAVSDLPLKE